MTHLDLLTKMLLRYPAADVSTENLAAMVEAVMDLDVEVLAYAIKRTEDDPTEPLGNCAFPPSVRQIRRHRPRRYYNASVGSVPVDRMAELPGIDQRYVLKAIGWQPATALPEGSP